MAALVPRSTLRGASLVMLRRATRANFCRRRRRRGRSLRLRPPALRVTRRSRLPLIV